MHKLKLITVILFFSQILFLSACGGSGDDEAQGQASSLDTTAYLKDSPEAEKTVVWRLNTEKSRINFLSVKKIHAMETHHFQRFKGFIYDDNSAIIHVDLSSLDTGIEIRDTRMLDVLFEVTTYPVAIASNTLDLAAINAMPAGSTNMQMLDTRIILHGVSQYIEKNYVIHKVAEDTLIVRSQGPLLINALDFDLTSGIDALKQLANLASISTTVPVDLLLVFTRG